MKVSSLRPGIRRGGADFGEQLPLLERCGARRWRGCAGRGHPAFRAGNSPGRARRRRWRRARRGPRDIRSGCRERPCLRSARRGGGWRGRCAGAGASCPWARPSGRRGRRRPSRCRGRGWRSRPGRAACPAAIAASTLRRASCARLPWWIPIGRALSFTAHRSWKISSARLRVLQKTRVVLCRSIRSITSRAAWRPECPPQGMRFSGIRIERSRLGTGIADDQLDLVHVRIRGEPAAIGVRIADRRRQADAAEAGRDRSAAAPSTATAGRRAFPWRSREARRRRWSSDSRTA